MKELKQIHDRIRLICSRRNKLMSAINKRPTPDRERKVSNLIRSINKEYQELSHRYAEIRRSLNTNARTRTKKSDWVLISCARVGISCPYSDINVVDYEKANEVVCDSCGGAMRTEAEWKLRNEVRSIGVHFPE
jgi:hypothetical protein